MSVLQLDEFKTRQRVTWEGGDSARAPRTFAEVGELVVSRAGITPEMRVLDVACAPPLWGREDHVRALFGSVATGFEFERHANRIEWESVEAFADFFMAHFPPMVTAKAMLGERFVEIRERIVDVWRRRNEATDSRLLLPQEYRLSIVRL